MSNEVCFSGSCRNPCEDRNACGLNALCQSANHVKTCSCPPTFTGNPEVECVRIPNTCVNDAGCSKGMRCNDGICMLGCKNDDNCATNERCQAGMCMLTCRLDNDCFLGHVCLNNMCLVGCKVNTDCPTSFSCIGNRCSDPCAGEASCGPNAQCQVVDQRAQCSCFDGFMPNPTAVVGCVREPVGCVTNKQCPIGHQVKNRF